MSRMVKEPLHTDDLQDIISKPPSWLLRWGISLVFFILLAVITMSAFIKYPDLIKADLKINAINAPKAIVPRTSGTLDRLLLNEGAKVNSGQVLAWMESSGDHRQILDLSEKLSDLRKTQYDRQNSYFYLDAPNNLDLGELQGAYQSFYQAYVYYQSAVSGGIYLKGKQFLEKEIAHEEQKQLKLREQKAIYEKDYELALKRHQTYRTLAEKKMISPVEMGDQESLLLSKLNPLQQISTNILASESNLSVRKKEIAELENKIQAEKISFFQALNSIISEIEKWKQQYVLIAQQEGELTYSGIVQEKQYVEANQPLFFINPKSTNYFGEMHVRQINMGKIKLGQRVLIKMASYPFEEYGAIDGKIVSITDIPYRDSVYLSKVKIFLNGKDSLINLKIGMTGQANIITEDASLLKRFGRNIIRIVQR